MSVNKIDARHRIKRSIIPGSTPTPAPSDDFTDGTWLITDIRPGEFFFNMADERLWIANSTGFSEVNLFTSGSTDYDFCSTGIFTSAISACTTYPIYVNSQSPVLNSGTTNSLLLGGSNNQILNSINNSLILGGQFLTATTSNTVYVPNLNIASGLTISSTANLNLTGTILGIWSSSTGSNSIIANNNTGNYVGTAYGNILGGNGNYIN